MLNLSSVLQDVLFNNMLTEQSLNEGRRIDYISTTKVLTNKQKTEVFGKAAPFRTPVVKELVLNNQQKANLPKLKVRFATVFFPFH